MIIECWSIILVVGIMAYVFLRMGQQGIAIGVLPLMILPFCHIISRQAGLLLARLLPILPLDGQIFVDVVALVVSGVLFGAVGHRMKGVRFRRVYLILCGSFTIILACIIISWLLTP